MCPFSDDESISMGGTIAKYSTEGKKVIVIIFSYGEASLPHLKPEYVKEVRLKKTYNPEKIFTHSETDPHHPGDHKAVYNVVTKAVDSIKKEYDLFTFEVWNIIPENKPVMYVDVSNYFNTKIKAISIFKSQWFSVILTILPVYIRAIKYGLKAKCRYAEKFYKIR